MANYMLIKVINSVETIDNIIVASPEVAATYLVANGGDYDYVLDESMYSPTPGIGWSYDSGLDSFSPPPEDFEGELESALLGVQAAIQAAANAYIAASSGDRSTAVGNVLSELSEDPEIDLMIAVNDYLSGLV